MWLSKDLVGFFQISHQTVQDLKARVSELEAENAVLQREVIATRTNFDWLRMKVNQLEFERAGLLEKAYNIKLPVPEIARQHQPIDPNEFSFEDLGDDLAKKLGLPVFDHKPAE